MMGVTQTIVITRFNIIENTEKNNALNVYDFKSYKKDFKALCCGFSSPPLSPNICTIT